MFNSPLQIRPVHWFIPFVFLLAGMAFNKNNEPLAGLIFALALLCVAWFFFFTWITEKHKHKGEAARYLEAYHRLTDEEKVELDFRVVKEAVRIENIRTDGRGNVQGKSIEWLPAGISPIKFHTWCTGVLNDPERSIVYSKWAGSDRLFSRPDYEKLLKVLEKPTLEYAFKRGSADNSPYILTEEGERFMEVYTGVRQSEV